MTITELENETAIDEMIKEAIEPKKAIILYNDDHNTFDWVIKCLVAYCNHNPQQAEQCAMIVHSNGKCDVKHGSFKELKPICEVLLEKGLSAKIE